VTAKPPGASGKRYATVLVWIKADQKITSRKQRRGLSE
jgi:hypothetical protein